MHKNAPRKLPSGAICLHGELQFAAEGGLGPLVLRGLAKIGAFVPIFDWGSFYFELPQS